MLGRGDGDERSPGSTRSPRSHPCAAVEAALALKWIPYERVDLLPLAQLLLGPLLYGGATVPGMRIDGERARRLARDHAPSRRARARAAAAAGARRARRYARVLEAERWGDEVFQAVPRRLIDAAFLRPPRAMESYAARGEAAAAGARCCAPSGAADRAADGAAQPRADENARADLAGLPRQLERIDGWIAEGLLGGEQPNAADLQIGSTIRLLLSIADVRPLLQRAPRASLHALLPADWSAKSRGRAAGRVAQPSRARAPAAQGLARELARRAPQRRPGPAHALVERRAPRARRPGACRPARAARSRARAPGRARSAGVSSCSCGQRSCARARSSQLAEQQDVDVDRARAVADAVRARGRARARAA